MKLLALFQFYLPFPLPRNGDWENATLAEQRKSLSIELAPMRRSEALFPRPVDEGLKGMVLSARVPGSGWPSAQRTVADVCIDRVRVHVFLEGAEADAKDASVKHQTWRAAADLLDRFLRHCRVAAHDWNIFGFRRDATGDLIPDDYFAYTVAWFDAKDGHPLFGGKGSEEAHGSLRITPARNVPFGPIAKAVAVGEEPGVAQRLLVDAEGHISSFRPHEGGILLGTACEVASDRFITRKGADADPAVEAILRTKNSFAKKRFDLITLHISKRSLQQEAQHVFDVVEAAYRLRNDLAHEARVTSWPGAYLAPVREAIEWLDTL